MVAPRSTSSRRSGAWTALRLSLEVSLAAAAALAGAWRAARVGARSVAIPGRSLLRAIVILPLRAAARCVGGVGAADRARAAAAWSGDGCDAARHPAHVHASGGAIVATTFVSIPLVILAAEAGLRSIDPRARGRGRRHGRLAWVRPAPGDAAAACDRSSPPALVLAWARALGEFGATITFAGNLAGRTQTLPLAVYQTRQTDPGAAILISLLLVALSLVVLVAMRDRIFAR